MTLNGQLHAFVALPWGEMPLVPIDRRVGKLQS